ncbi:MULTISPECIES: type II toxin-antitoxin system PemK/MazF family toxin [Cupriavidus]|uniref:type II toxin-antitoxin system PemK/MazF family toxin n=1 Tax=Cupriavidus taiwanensis TaxID=164546 RepID=UPI001573E9F4|nr:type II toxin-antitoxin system PemK/MazF family toxin [Cupriavidus taiwanensis]NSX13168.1 type II toxin-antitoxin system PemK/MazF family toxin [Cupriavidus taiwanensis]
MIELKRGQVWEVDLNPQTHREEPAKRNRPALVLQTDLLNDAGHPTTIVVPGTSQIEMEDCFPLRVALGKLPGLAYETDLLIDQVRAVSNRRFMGSRPVATLAANHLRKVEEAMRLLLRL